MKQVFVLFLCFFTVIAAIAQKTKPKPKPKPIVKSVTVKNTKLKDSVSKLLSSGKWQMDYVIQSGEKTTFKDKMDVAKLPKMLFASDGKFYGFDAGDNVVGKWSLSNDGKQVTTVENKNTDTFIIVSITTTELALKLKGTKDTIGFILLQEAVD